MSDLYGEDISIESRDAYCDVCRQRPHELGVPWGHRGRARVCGPCEAVLADQHESLTHDCKRWGCA